MEASKRLIPYLAAILSLMLSSPEISAADGIDEAYTLYQAGRFDAAITLLEDEIMPELEARRDTVSLLKAWSILGCCHVEKGEHQTAARYCNLTVKARDYYGEEFHFVTNIIFGIGQMYHRLGSYDEALPYIDRSIAYENEIGRLNLTARRYVEKATILMDKGDYAGALEVLETAQPLNSSRLNAHYQSHAIYLKGLCHEMLGNKDAANEVFRSFEDSYQSFNVERTAVPGLSLKIGEYALAASDTATAEKMYRFAIFNAKHTHEYEVEAQALKALAGIYKDSDPEASARCLARIDSLSFAPYVSELALKMALVGVEFPRREQEQRLQIQRMRNMTLVLFVALLSILALMLWYKFRASQRVTQVERDKSEMLERELEQKQRLLELAESASDDSFRQKVRQIANEFGSVESLTRREREICAMITQGLINKEIADKLSISLRTVQTHRNTIYRKLGVSNTAELIKALEEPGKQL